MENKIPSMENDRSTTPEMGSRRGPAFSAQTKEKFKKAMKLAKTWWLFFTILLIWIVIMQYIVAEKYEAVVNTSGENSEISANIAADGLDFGALPKGNSSTRFITIENRGKYDVYVKVYKWGGISKFLEMNRNNFVLESGESENLEFMLEIPSSAEEKRYEGRVIIFEIPKLL